MDFTKNKTNGFHPQHRWYGFTNNEKPKFISPALEKRVCGCLTFSTNIPIFYSEIFTSPQLVLHVTTVRNKRD